MGSGFSVSKKWVSYFFFASPLPVVSTDLGLFGSFAFFGAAWAYVVAGTTGAMSARARHSRAKDGVRMIGPRSVFSVHLGVDHVRRAIGADGREQRFGPFVLLERDVVLANAGAV